MCNRASIAAVVPPERRPCGDRLPRAAAITEVLLAFAFVHVAFRGFKHFTELGRLEGEARLNFTPGVVMILFTVCLLLLCRRSFEAYGLTAARWTEGLKVGLIWGVVLVAGGASLRLLGRAPSAWQQAAEHG